MVRERLERAGSSAPMAAANRAFQRAEKHPSLPLVGLRFARRIAPRSLSLAQAQALLTVRSAGWSAARPLFLEIAKDVRETDLPDGLLTKLSLRRGRPCPPLVLAKPLGASSELLKRVVVYTTQFGSEPRPTSVNGMSEHVRFLCFSDDPSAAEGWTVLPTDPSPTIAKRLKIRPHEALAEAAPEAEWSLYLDPNQTLVGNLDMFVRRWLLGSAFALWRHTHAVDWRDLAERHLLLGDAPAASVLDEVDACLSHRIPLGQGAYDTQVLWRRHVDPDVKALMENWWAATQATTGPDDVTLYRMLASRGPRTVGPVTMPAALGCAEDNNLTARLAPRRPSHRTRRAAPSVRSGRVPVTFLYQLRKTGMNITTLLRGKMLSELIAARFADVYDVSFVRDIDAVRGQVVIADGQALYSHELTALRRLQDRNVAVIGAWEDSRPRIEAVRFLDAHMTLSIRQKLDLQRLFPDKPAYFVTHQVNPLIPKRTPPSDRLRTGYFGGPQNTLRPPSLAESVDLVHTGANDGGWIEALREYNCHWVVRNKLPQDGWKPFLKGFVAARCGAPVIITRDDANAAHYLGDDYPFYADSLAEADLEMAWVRAAAGFHGPDWRLALDVMRHVEARSTLEQVFTEFRTMIDDVAR